MRSGGDFWRLKELGIQEDVKIIYMDLLELTNIWRVIEKVKPDEVYNLAAQSFVAASFEQPILTSEVNAMGTLRLLEVLRVLNQLVKCLEMLRNTLKTKTHASIPGALTLYQNSLPTG